MTATALAIRKFLTPDPLSITSTMVVKQEVAAALADPDGHVVFQARIQEAVQGPDFR